MPKPSGSFNLANNLMPKPIDSFNLAKNFMSKLSR